MATHILGSGAHVVKTLASIAATRQRMLSRHRIGTDATHTKQTKLNDGQWQCNACTLIQSTDNSLCELCQTPKHCYIESNWNCYIDECLSVKHLVTLMNKYDGSSDKEPTTAIFRRFLDHYLHCIHCHSTDDDFAFIFKQLSFCNVQKCQHIMRRNYSDKDEVQQKEPTSNACVSIMDKIHSYFHHSYDIGHRFTQQEKAIISTTARSDDDEKQMETEYPQIDAYLTSPFLIKTRQIMDTQVQNLIVTKTNNRYTNSLHTYNATQNQQNKANVYSFGYQFKYGHEESWQKRANGIDVSPKYNDLKQELISNPFYRLTIQVFDHEYIKAESHFESQYCKQYVAAVGKLGMRLEYILSLMIYCNFDPLQCELSKTYRNDNGVNHEHFYHFGKSLKIAVLDFGTDRDQNHIESYYHGIDKFVPLQQYMPPKELVYGLAIFCPLSTTSSLQVASKFSTNEGLIINFGYSPNGFAKNFSMRWLSDYPSENEYLFIQNEDGLQIHDLIHVRNNMHYAQVLNALKTIEKITSVAEEMINHTELEIVFWSDETKHIRIEMQPQIISQILSQRASYKHNDKDDTFLIDIYNSYFGKKKKLMIDYIQCKHEHKFMSEILLSRPATECIDMEICDAIFPNLQQIEIRKINLTATVMQYLLNYLQSVRKSKVPLESIIIKRKQDSELSVQEAVSTFSAPLRQLDIFLCAHGSKLEFHLNHGIMESALHLLLNVHKNKGFNAQADHQITETMATLMEHGIKRGIQMVTLSDNYEQYNISKKYYNECVKLEGFGIFWDEIKWYNISYIFEQFYIAHYDWMKMNAIKKIFPSLRHIAVHGINLSLSVLDDIFNYLSQNPTELDWIEIHLNGDSDINASDSIATYQEAFHLIGFDIQKVHGIQILGRPTGENVEIKKLSQT
eukprot:175821_1